MTTRCEDYPCCGHTDGLPCNWTYTPEARAYDEAHAMCDHAAGVCDAYEDEDEGCDPHNGVCEIEDPDECPNCRDYWLNFEAEAMEDAWLDGSYEE